MSMTSKLSISTLETKNASQPPKKDPEIEEKDKRSKRRSRGGGGRKEEPRRRQNATSQKRYRDKRVNTAHLVSPSTPFNVHTDQQMSKYIVKIRRALNDRTTVSSMKCLVDVYQIVDEYRESIQSKLNDHL